MASRTTHDNVEDITFGSKDLEGVSSIYDNALVISTIVTNFEVKRILIDNGSFVDILSHEAFTKMRILAEQLKVVKTIFRDLGMESSSRNGSSNFLLVWV